MQANPTVFLVGTDSQTNRSIDKIATIDHYAIEIFPTAADFLASYHIHITGCLITDLEPENRKGLELLQQVRLQPHSLPVIFISEQPNVRIAVEAMRRGALHFLEKPMALPELQNILHEGITLDMKNRQARLELMVLKARYANLTERENQIFHLISDKQSNTQIAKELGITVKTVEFHRAHVMEKMYADSVCELLNMAKMLNTIT